MSKLLSFPVPDTYSDHDIALAAKVFTQHIETRGLSRAVGNAIHDFKYKSVYMSAEAWKIALREGNLKDAMKYLAADHIIERQEALRLLREGRISYEEMFQTALVTRTENEQRNHLGTAAISGPMVRFTSKTGRPKVGVSTFTKIEEVPVKQVYLHGSRKDPK